MRREEGADSLGQSVSWLEVQPTSVDSQVDGFKERLRGRGAPIASGERMLGHAGYHFLKPSPFSPKLLRNLFRDPVIVVAL